MYSTVEYSNVMYSTVEYNTAQTSCWVVLSFLGHSSTALNCTGVQFTFSELNTTELQ